MAYYGLTSDDLRRLRWYCHICGQDNNALEDYCICCGAYVYEP